MSNPQFAGTTLGNFSPNQIAGLNVWIDASQTGSFTLTGGTSNLATITDIAENVAYTVAGTPSWSTTAFTSANGLTYPAFNMTNGRLIRAVTNSFTSFQHTGFIVGRRNVLTGDGWPAVAMATTTGGSGQFFRVLDNRDPSVTANFRAVAFGTAVSLTSNANTTQPFLYVNSFNGAATLKSYIYYSRQYLPFFPSGVNPAFTAGSNGNAVMIGTDGSTGAQTANLWPGTFCEIILYRNTVLSSSDRERVEGYLAQKWGLVANLPNGHPYANFPLISSLPATGFDPRSIAGMSLWLDAQDTTTITGNPVTTWIDKSGARFNATSATGPSQGTYNGYRVLSFNGTTQRMLSSHTVNPASHTLILVYRPAVLTGNYSGNTSVFRYQPSGPYIVFPYMNGTVQRGYITSYDGTPIDAGNSTLVANAVTTALNIVIANITSGSQQILLNGTQQSSNTRALTAGTSGTLAIGYYPPGGNEFFQGDIGEMMVYSRPLNATEQTNIVGYLGWKWGRQAALPVASTWLTNDIRNYTFLPTLPALIYQPLIEYSVQFSPLSIRGSVVWMDAADSTTFTFSSGTTISQIVNKAPGATAISATGSPSLTQATLNGRQSVLMGSGNYLSGATSVSGTSITCIAVAMTTAALPRVGSDQRLISLVTATSLDYDNAGALIGIFNQQSSANIGTYRNFTFTSAIPFSQNVPFIGASIYDGATGQLFKDGSPGNSTGSAGTFGITKFSLGLQLNSPGNTEYWIGYIGEVLVYNRNLSFSERQTIEGYLAWKWGLVANLPAGHPFKLYPPPP